MKVANRVFIKNQQLVDRSYKMYAKDKSLPPMVLVPEWMVRLIESNFKR